MKTARNRMSKRVLKSTLSTGIVGLITAVAGTTARAQTTYTYAGANGASWIRSSNWTGGVSGKTPGVDANANTTTDGTTSDIAAFSSSSSITSLGINFNTGTGTGVAANGAANQSLSLGEITFSTGASAGGFTLNNSSTTLDGTLTLNGATGSATPTVIVANSSASNYTFANGTSNAMDVALGNTTSVIQISGTGNVIFTSKVKDGAAASSLTVNNGGATGTTGALLLNGANTYTGGTTVNSGILGGSGTILGSTTVAAGATLAPGATGGTSIAKLMLGTATTGVTTINGAYAVNLTGAATPTAGTSYDQISVLGALTLNTTSSALAITTTSATGLAINQVLYIGLNDGIDAIAGTFGTLIEGSTVTDNLGDTFRLSYLANGDTGATGNDISLTVLTTVPEPATILGGVLLIGAASWSQRRRLGGWLAAVRSCRTALAA